MNVQDIEGVEPFEFRGSAGQWLGIWIVNLLLTIVTVGIYSAWAKVRTKKYFYQHTYVAGRNFDYHATGLQILIGRFIVIGAIVAYSIFSAMMPLVGALMALAFIVMLPFLMVRSLNFNAQMSSWSNVRFRFNGSVGMAAVIYFVFPILMFLTLYTTFPLFDRQRRRYILCNHSLGKSSFDFDGSLRAFYGAFLAAIAWVLFVSIVIVALAAPYLAGFNFAAFDPATLENDPMAGAAIFGAFYAFLFLALFPAFTIYNAFIRNAVFNDLTLEGGHRFYSNVNALVLFWIALSNALLVLCSLGLLLPFAQIRMSKYLARHTSLLPNGSLDTFLAGVDRQRAAVGDAYTDLEGIDLGLPV